MKLRKYKKYADYFFHKGDNTNTDIAALLIESLKNIVKTGKYIKVSIYEEDK